MISNLRVGLNGWAKLVLRGRYNQSHRRWRGPSEVKQGAEYQLFLLISYPVARVAQNCVLGHPVFFQRLKIYKIKTGLQGKPCKLSLFWEGGGKCQSPSEP